MQGMLELTNMGADKRTVFLTDEKFGACGPGKFLVPGGKQQ
jgi:hypothetical protein